MTRIAPSPLVAALIALGLNAAPAQAQLSRTAVSAARGNDANNCDVVTPCRTFQRAHDATNDQGEITVLDPGGYGALNITKSISVMNDGVGEASILVSGGAIGITINAAAAGYVNLRGITIQGIGFGGSTGLRFNSGFALTIENCVIRNHTGNGIEFVPTTNSSLSVSNTLVADNGGDGIHVKPSSGSPTVKAAFYRVEAYNNSNAGIIVDGTASNGAINATATESVAADNGGAGFSASSTSAPVGHAQTGFMIVRSTAANNGTGFTAGQSSTATIRLSQSTAAGNGVGVSTTGDGNLMSYGDNTIDGNTTEQSQAPTSMLMKK